MTHTASKDNLKDLELSDPQPARRRYLGGPAREALQVQLKTTTPILGGAPVPREVDEVDIIRVPTIRGHLRFWWRALYAHEYPTAAKLTCRERELWGGVGNNEATRSRVELHVEVDRQSVEKDPDDIKMNTEGAYALWPARAQKENGVEKQPPAPRLKPNVFFQLRLVAPAEDMRQVENSLRAWVLWGGYGGRTRRGLGGLTVIGDASKWLPSAVRRDEFSRLFGGVPLLGDAPRSGVHQVPVMQGARLGHGATKKDPMRAWSEALAWLRDFRQQQPLGPSKRPDDRYRYAREWGDSKRPGRSNWPEPDKIRRLLTSPRNTKWAHPPRAEYSRTPAWPRAGFGLPIIIRFQDKDRKTERKYLHLDPGDVELRWHDGENVRERLASPLIVKAMPLSDGSFVPVALWLCRAWPEGNVVLLRKGDKNPVRDSAARFDAPLVAPDDKALYAPLQAPTLRDAFFNWLKTRPDVKEF